MSQSRPKYVTHLAVRQLRASQRWGLEFILWLSLRGVWDGPLSPHIYHSFTHVFTQHTRWSPALLQALSCVLRQDAPLLTISPGQLRTRPRGVSSSREEGGLDVMLTELFLCRGLLCSPSVAWPSPGGLQRRGKLLTPSGSMACADREAGGAASFWSAGKTIPHSRGALHLPGEARLCACRAPGHQRATCVVGRLYIQRPIAKGTSTL